MACDATHCDYRYLGGIHSFSHNVLRHTYVHCIWLFDMFSAENMCAICSLGIPEYIDVTYIQDK